MAWAPKAYTAHTQILAQAQAQAQHTLCEKSGKTDVHNDLPQAALPASTASASAAAAEAATVGFEPPAGSCLASVELEV